MISLMAEKTSKLEMKFKRSSGFDLKQRHCQTSLRKESASLPKVTDDQILPPQIYLSDSDF